MKFVVAGILSVLVGLGYVALCHFYPSPGAWWWLEFNQARNVLLVLLLLGYLLVRYGLRHKPRR